MDIQALLAITPDLEEGGQGDGGTIRFRSHDLDKLIAECRRLKTEALHAAGPYQVTKQVYARADAVDSY